MRPVQIPLESRRPLPFYLAAEEWLAMQPGDKEYFFVWQVDPTVIIGRHQLLEREVDTEYCRRNGVAIFRRKSGGGAVVADRGNLMLSCITRSPDGVASTFARYTSMVVASLRALGLDASDNSRNDILIGGRKVSGNSFLSLPSGRSIVHGTMLLTVDHELMSRVLTPSASKLRSHGVKSVRSRVTTLCSHLPGLTVSRLTAHLMATIPDEPPYILTDADIRDIEAIEQSYYSPEWIMGKSPRGTLSATGRIEGVGEMDIYLTIDHGRIENVELRGDFLETADADALVGGVLRGLPLDRRRIAAALDDADIGKVVPGLTGLIFADRLFAASQEN